MGNQVTCARCSQPYKQSMGAPWANYDKSKPYNLDVCPRCRTELRGASADGSESLAQIQETRAKSDQEMAETRKTAQKRQYLAKKSRETGANCTKCGEFRPKISKKQPYTCQKCYILNLMDLNRVQPYECIPGHLLPESRQIGLTHNRIVRILKGGKPGDQ